MGSCVYHSKPYRAIITPYGLKIIKSESGAAGCIDNLKSNKVKGVLSTHARYRAKRVINAWATHNMRVYKKLQLRSVTLTLQSAQKQGDKEVKRRLLNNFLNYLRRTVQCNYYWRAEAQMNGNIHFHLLIDKWIDKREVQYKWNSICLKQGYKAENAPSTRIDGVKHVKQYLYLLKYVGKTKEGERKLKGRIHGFSRGLSKIKELSMPTNSSQFRKLENNLKITPKKALKSDFFDFVFVPIQKIAEIIDLNDIKLQNNVDLFGELARKKLF